MTMGAFQRQLKTCVYCLFELANFAGLWFLVITRAYVTFYVNCAC